MFTTFRKKKHAILLNAAIGLIAYMGLVPGRAALATDQEPANAQQARPAISKPKRPRAEEALSKRETAAIEEAFNGALNSRNPLALYELINGSNNAKKAWIFEELVSRIGSDPDPRMRSKYVASMDPFQEAGAEVAARVLASDPEYRVRVAAVMTLGSIGTEKQVEALLDAIRADRGIPGQGRKVATFAIGALCTIGGDKAAQAIKQVWQSEELSAGCREVALSALGRTGDPSLLETIQAELEADYQPRRMAAIRALSALARKNPGKGELVATVLATIRELLTDSKRTVRESAARALGDIGTREDIQLLEGLLEDSATLEGTYTENGEVKTKTVYPVREVATEAIAKINKRYPPEEKPSPAAGYQQGKTTQTSEPNEAAAEPSPTIIGRQATRYILGAIGIGVVIMAAILMLRKKQAKLAK